MDKTFTLENLFGISPEDLTEDVLDNLLNEGSTPEEAVPGDETISFIIDYSKVYDVLPSDKGFTVPYIKN